MATTTRQQILSRFDREVKKSRDLLEAILSNIEDIDNLGIYPKDSGLSILEVELGIKCLTEEAEEELDDILGGNYDHESGSECSSYFIRLSDQP